jgi:hypothetical protein
VLIYVAIFDKSGNGPAIDPDTLFLADYFFFFFFSARSISQPADCATWSDDAHRFPGL